MEYVVFFQLQSFQNNNLKYFYGKVHNEGPRGI